VGTPNNRGGIISLTWIRRRETILCHIVFYGSIISLGAVFKALIGERSTRMGDDTK